MEERSVIELITLLVFQLTAILLAAKLAGEIAQRWLKVPAVIGELLIGILIGPFALGQYEITSSFGPLFPLPEGYGTAGGTFIPISTELYAIGQIGVIVLLFLAGLETNAKMFFRYAGPGLAVASGGVILPFVFGDLATVALGFADSFSDPPALFMGAIMTATSVGITARVLSEKRKLDTPEGVTVLAGAVIDDVLGIIILSVVVGITESDSISLGNVVRVSLKAAGFWAGLTAIGFILSKRISRLALSFNASGAALGLALSLALLSSGLAEEFGLAAIIGAYSIGLALSGTQLARLLEEQLRHLANAIVPVFFVLSGMVVDLGSFSDAIDLGILITVLAIVGKIIGAGVPATVFGFNLRGAMRIGIGMLPRGEVALIVAGIGLSEGVIQQDLFGVAILMTIVTTVVAPIFLVPLFETGGSGLKHPPEPAVPRPSPAPAGAPAMAASGAGGGTRYEVTVDERLGHWFIERLLVQLGASGFAPALHTAGTNREVWEHDRGGQTVSTALHRLEDGTATVRVASENADISRELSEAVRLACGGIVQSFLSPVAGSPPEELETRFQAGMAEFWKGLGHLSGDLEEGKKAASSG